MKRHINGFDDMDAAGSGMHGTTVLVVDDEREIADLVAVYLEAEGYASHVCYDAKTAQDAIAERAFDLAILDVMLPDVNGFQLCRQIRQSHTYPVIMLTARDAEVDKIAGLTFGADDYLTKPFRPLELVARVKANSVVTGNTTPGRHRFLCCPRLPPLFLHSATG